MCEIWTVPQNKVSHNDQHFTVLGFTTLDSSSVLCMVIIAVVQQKFEVETGLDIEAKMVDDPTDKDFFEKITEERTRCTQWVQSASSGGRPSLV